MCHAYLVNHHNLYFVQLHCLLLQDLKESPRGGYDNLKRDSKEEHDAVESGESERNLIVGGNYCKNIDCTLMLLLRRWSCWGSGMPPTSNTVLMLGRPITNSLACLSI